MGGGADFPAEEDLKSSNGARCESQGQQASRAYERSIARR